MQAIRRTIQSIQMQLRGLTPTAKLLIGSLMIIMVMCLFLVSLYAGAKDMVALGLRSDVSNTVRTQVVQYLETHRIPFEDRGGDVFVASNQKIAVLGKLADQNLIDGDQINFETLIADSSPFRTRDENRTRYLVAKMNVLSGMIAQMSGIERAKVVIDPPDTAGGIGRSSIPTSASVSVQTRSGELTQSQVDAIAHLVARSQAGLKPQNVAIIDARSGRSLHARSEDSAAVGRYLEVKQAAERHTKTALAGALDFIPGVLIEVNAQVDATDEVKQKSSFDDPKLGVTSESTHVTSNTTTTPAAEPAVRSNTGMNIASSSGGTSLSDERNDTSSVPAFGREQSQIRDPKGYPLQINASIGVPRSYFTRLMTDSKATAGGEAAGDANGGVDAAEFDALVVKETDRLKTYITPLIDTQAIEGASAGTVNVMMVADYALPVVDVPEVTNASSSLIASAVGGEMVKTISLGGLAVLSVAMMFLMVRRAGAKPTLPTAAELVGIPPALAAAETDLVGEADEASSALEGVELTDDTMRRQQMLDQITSMAQDSPEDVAGLLRRWIKSEV